MVLYRKKSATELEEVSALQIRIFDENTYDAFFATTIDATTKLVTEIRGRTVTASTNGFVNGEVIGIVNHGMFKVNVYDNDTASLTEITNDKRLRAVESTLSSTITSLDSATSNSVKKSDKNSSGVEQTQTMLAPLTVNETFKAGLAGTTGKYALQVTNSASPSGCKTTIQGQLEVANAGDPSVFNGNLTVKGQLAVGSIVFTSS